MWGQHYIFTVVNSKMTFISWNKGCGGMGGVDKMGVPDIESRIVTSCALWRMTTTGKY